MKLLDEEINCTLFFKYNQNELKDSPGKMNPYTGSIKHKFSGLNVSHVTFNYDSKDYQFELFNLGGRYFMKNYESSPFYRLFTLDQDLPYKNEPQVKKLKI